MPFMQIGVGGVHLMRIGDFVEVKVMIDGEWLLVIRTPWNSNFSHVVEAPELFEKAQEAHRRAG